MFQNPDNQIVMPTVAAEVALGTGAQQLSNEEVCKKVFAVLDKVNMAEFAEVATGTLSGGQKQRTAIAAALAQGPPAPQVRDLWFSFPDASSLAWGCSVWGTCCASASAQ